MTAVLFAYADGVQEWNCSEWRQHTPSNGLNAAGHRGRMLPLGDFMQYGHPVIQQFVSEFDVIVVQRNLFEPQVWAACDYWRALDKLVCADLDDDYPRLTPQNPAHMFWIKDASGLERRTGLPPVKALEEGLRHVDALIAPSRTLLADWADVVPGMYFPNLAHGPWYESIEQKPLPGAAASVICRPPPGLPRSGGGFASSPLCPACGPDPPRSRPSGCPCGPLPAGGCAIRR